MEMRTRASDFETYRKELGGGRRGGVECIAGFAGIPIGTLLVAIALNVAPSLGMAVVPLGFILGVPLGVHGLVQVWAADRAARELGDLAKEEWRIGRPILPEDLARRFRQWPSLEPPALSAEQERRVRLAQRIRVDFTVFILFMWGFLGYFLSIAVASRPQFPLTTRIAAVTGFVVVPFLLLAIVLVRVRDGFALLTSLREYEAATGRQVLPSGARGKGPR